MKKKTNTRKQKSQNGHTVPVWREDKRCFELRITYVDINGEKKRKSFSSQSVPECIEKRNKFFRELELKRDGVVMDSTIPEILRTDNERRLIKNKQKEQGYGRNEDTIKYIEKSSLGALEIKNITVPQIDHFLLYELPRYAQDTIDKIYRMLKKAFVIAAQRNIIERNPFDDERNDLERPNSNKLTKKIPPLSVEEQKKFEEALQLYSQEKTACNKYHRQLLIELYTGMRMGEINALTPADIDFKEGEISITKTISRDRNKKPFISPIPKTNSGIRKVPIISIVEEQLRLAISEMISNENQLIFCNKKTGGLITTQQVNSAYKRICKKAGITESGQHQLRHTYGTRSVEAGVDYKALSETMGHKDIHITIDTYVSTLPAHREENIKRLTNYLNRIHREDM